MTSIDRTSKGSTASLVARLAGQVEDKPVRPVRMRAVFAYGITAAALAALAIVTFVIGWRSDLADLVSSWTFNFKVAAMGLAALAGVSMMWRASVPGAPIRPILLLLPAAGFMITGVVLDSSGFPLSGINRWSTAKCVSSIVLAAAPALFLLLASMRKGIPTNLVRAGAVAGLLAGSLGGAAYSLACLNDGAAFVALWYSVAIALTTGLGAFLGPRTLAW